MPEWEQKVWGRRRQLLKKNCVEVYMLELSLAEGKPVCCSMHQHHMKHNRFYVLEGSLGVETELESVIVAAGDSYTIAPTIKHRFTVLAPARVIESTWASEITEDIDRDDVGHVLEAE